MPEVSAGKITCAEPGCGRSFKNENGLRIHAGRTRHASGLLDTTRATTGGGSVTERSTPPPKPRRSFAAKRTKRALPLLDPGFEQPTITIGADGIRTLTLPDPPAAAYPIAVPVLEELVDELNAGARLRNTVRALEAELDR